MEMFVVLSKITIKLFCFVLIMPFYAKSDDEDDEYEQVEDALL